MDKAACARGAPPQLPLSQHHREQTSAATVREYSRPERDGDALAQPTIEARWGSRPALILCFVAAMLDGVDIQSMSLVASQLGPEFGVGPAEIGYIGVATVISGALGAAVGGRLSDRIGRKAVLIVSLSALGLFSLLTAFAHDLATLLAARVLTAMGMGGAMLSLIADLGEVAPARRRAGVISLMFCGMPLGGAAGGLLLFLGEPEIDWRAIFYVGGLGPLILAPLMMLGFRDRRANVGDAAGRPRLRRASPGPSVPQVLFGDRRTVATVSLWLSFFCTFMASNLLVSWLPWLMQGKGLTRPESVLTGTVMSLGAASGILLFGRVIDAGKASVAIGAMYLGTALSLTALSVFNGLSAMVAAACTAGFFGIGGQFVLHVLALQTYPISMRGTALGAASVAGRCGSMVGPLVGGTALAAGAAPAAILACTVPGLVVGAIAASVVLSKGRASPEPAAAE
jgi:AAHS family 3-hydroxyphenylpropionic acid transporter